MKNKFLLIILTLLIISPFALAGGPAVHARDARLGLEGTSQSTIVNVIKNNIDYYYAGTLLNDMSVFGYFSEGFGKIGQTYKATHSPGFVQCIFSKATRDQQLALGYGSGTHVIVDHYFHNFFVPRQIKQTNLPNFAIHGSSELAIDSEFQKRNPQDLESIKKGLSVFLEDEETVDLVQSCLLSSQGKAIDVRETTALLLGTLGTGSFFSSVWGVSAIYVPLAQGDILLGWTFLIIASIVGLGAFLPRLKDKILPTIWKLNTGAIAFIAFVLMQVFFVLTFFGSNISLMFLLTSIFMTIWIILSLFTRGGRIALMSIFGFLGTIMALGGLSIFIADNAAAWENEQAVRDISTFLSPQGFATLGGFDATGAVAIAAANDQVNGIFLLIIGVFIITSIAVFFIQVKKVKRPKGG